MLMDRGAVKHERITVDPRIMVGKPVIKGTRIPVEQIIREMAGGMDMAAIMDAHPRLTAEDIYATLAYAADISTYRTKHPKPNE
jgi:uncharacterized protein (DUF433 family)